MESLVGISFRPRCEERLEDRVQPCEAYDWALRSIVQSLSNDDHSESDYPEGRQEVGYCNTCVNMHNTRRLPASLKSPDSPTILNSIFPKLLPLGERN